MATLTGQPSPSDVLELARRQHGVVSWRQLAELGLSGEAVRHRVRTGHLHRVRRGVYAVGRPELDRYGELLAAVLGCGPRAVISHLSAAALWGIRPAPREPAEVSVPTFARARPLGVTVHRRTTLTARDVTRCHGVPVTSPVQTLI